MLRTQPHATMAASGRERTFAQPSLGKELSACMIMSGVPFKATRKNTDIKLLPLQVAGNVRGLTHIGIRLGDDGV